MLMCALGWSATTAGIDVGQRMEGFDAYMAKILKD
jgi:hypothetical protein